VVIMDASSCRLLRLTGVLVLLLSTQSSGRQLRQVQTVATLQHLPPVPVSAIPQPGQVGGNSAAGPGTPPGLQHVNEPTPSAPWGQAPPQKPKLFFLFLVYTKINNEAVWNRFFSPATHGTDFYALVHCKSETACRANINAQQHYEIIPSVGTQYCSNLISGMNALLGAALQKRTGGGPGSPLDKFLFVSDSTLPAKPFHFVQQGLTTHDTSHFCVFPRNQWAQISSPAVYGQPAPVAKLAVKHHQWVILSRKHAELAIERATWNHDLMVQFQLNQGSRNLGCTDEFWYFSTLFQTFNITGQHFQSFNLDGFAGGQLSTNDLEIQGSCTTFVNWHAQASGTNNNITRLAHELAIDPGTDLTPLGKWSGRPSSIKHLSQSALWSLRQSPFLFVRKVEDGATFSGCGELADAFENQVLASTPRPIVIAFPFRGEGSWMHSDGITYIDSVDGSLRLWAADGTSLQARGGYCGDAVHMVWTNGFTATGSVSPDGLSIQWSNGVFWKKAADVPRVR